MTTRWKTSSFSGGNGGDCVEVGCDDEGVKVAVRDSKNRGGGFLVIPQEGFAAFLAEVKAGKFDR